MVKPTLDMSDVLLSTEFLDEFLVIRRKEDRNNFGEPLLTTSKLRAFGVVTTPGPNDLVRTTDTQYVRDMITIVTKFRLFPASKKGAQEYQPDIVLYAGTHYLVDQLQDYTRYGAGFVQANCSSYDYMDPPPQ